jgi:hypothetical protein
LLGAANEERLSISVAAVAHAEAAFE